MHRRFETGTPRVAVGVSAVVMTAITIGAMVVLPARMGVDRAESVLAASKVINEASASAVSYSVADYLAVHELALTKDTCACDAKPGSPDAPPASRPPSPSPAASSVASGPGPSVRPHTKKTKTL